MRFQETLIALVGVLAASAEAAEIHWKNGVNGNWSTGTNWVGDIAPGPLDTAVIDVAGTYTVTLDVSPTVAGFTLKNIYPTCLRTDMNFAVNGSSRITTRIARCTGAAWTGTNGKLLQSRGGLL
jgi:hypothetical protein